MNKRKFVELFIVTLGFGVALYTVIHFSLQTSSNQAFESGRDAFIVIGSIYIGMCLAYFFCQIRNCYNYIKNAPKTQSTDERSTLINQNSNNV